MQWLGYTILTFGLFFAAAVSVFAQGLAVALHYVLGAMWFWNLVSWARMRKQRRRGWLVKVSESPDGTPLVDYWGRQ